MNVSKILKGVANTILCVAVFFLTSCNKNPRGTYTIKGKVMDSCISGKPFANKDLVISIKVGGNSATIAVHDSIGVGKTDAEGNYAISCQNWGGGKISVDYKEYNIISKYIGSGTNTKKDMEGQMYDFGTSCIHK